MIHGLDEKTATSLTQLGFVFADVGASGELPPRYSALAPLSDLIRFDPDVRAVVEIENTFGKKIVTINKAVIEDDRKEIAFQLTRSPYCSSSLLPDFQKLSAFEYEHLFEVTGEVCVPATTLDAVINEYNISGINWINLDTQGTELRILKSISEAEFHSVVAVDVESSLYAHYLEADTFPEIHRFMDERGFWIAETRPHLRTRITKEASAQLSGQYRSRWLKGHFSSTLHKAPTSIECCYLRTIRSAMDLNFKHDDFCRLSIACLAAEVPEYAFQVNHRCVALFGATDATNAIKDLVDKMFARRLEVSKWNYVRQYFRRKFGRG